MSRFKNDHSRKCDVFVLGGDDASHSLPPPSTPTSKLGSIVHRTSVVGKMVLFLSRPETLPKLCTTLKWGGGGGRVWRNVFHVGGTAHLD